jgi:PHD/YefM family antitoxin component YafN of YafNO toxin-antitoxin module
MQASDDKDQRLQEMEGRLNEALRREKETKARACQMLEKYDAAEVLYRSEYEKQIAELEGQNEKLRRKMERLKGRGI